MSIQKKVTFAEPKSHQSVKERIGLDSDRSLENVPDESEDLKNNSLFDDKNLLLRMGAVSQIQTKTDMASHSVKSKSIKLRSQKRKLRKEAEQMEK